MLRIRTHRIIGRNFARVLAIAAIAFLSTFCQARRCFGYSVLTHEAIIDAEWDGLIKTALLQKFPNATPEQLNAAHAYAYGGSVIQDMGYYPFASRFFSHLAHYVRSRDFINALFEESRDVDDYAFALGALSHFSADIQGHALGINRAVPLLYPKLRNKYGDWMTWEDNPEAHALTEFGYDTLEVVARHNAPQAFHDSIGFKVPKALLQRAFKRTYNLELSDQMFSLNLALFSYRRLASKFIPEMTEVAWAMRRRELEDRAASEHHAALYHLSQKSYESWMNTYTNPGVGDKLTAFLVRLVPKFGMLNEFQFHAPTEQTEELFADSLQATVQDYEKQLRAEIGGADPPDINLDTGAPTRLGEYRTCDRTYARLLNKLDKNHFAGVSRDLRANILHFYDQPSDNPGPKTPVNSKRAKRELDELRALNVSPESQPSMSTKVSELRPDLRHAK